MAYDTKFGDTKESRSLFIIVGNDGHNKVSNDIRYFMPSKKCSSLGNDNWFTTSCYKYNIILQSMHNLWLRIRFLPTLTCNDRKISLSQLFMW